MGRYDEIRSIAYAIWEQEGCPNGKDCEHWFKAAAVWEGRQKDPSVPSDAKARLAPAVKQRRKDMALK